MTSNSYYPKTKSLCARLMPICLICFAVCFSAIGSLAVFGAPVEVICAEWRGAKQPQIAMTALGEVGVAFGKDNSIYVVRSTDSAKSFSTPELVGSVQKLSLEMRRGPRIATVGESFVVSAISHADGNLFAWHQPARRASWKQVQINDTPRSAREGLHAMAANGKRVFCAWLDLRNDKTELWGALSKDGGKTWGKNLRVYQSPSGHICECCHPSTIFTPSGEIVVMWRNWLDGSRDMYWAGSKDGKNFTAAQKLGSGTWPLNACPMDGGSLAINSNGQPVSIWRRDEKIFSVIGDATEKLISERGSQPVIARGAHDMFFIWQRNGAIFLKSNADTTAVRKLAENAAYPSIVSASGKHPAVIVWESTLTKTIFADTLQ